MLSPLPLLLLLLPSLSSATYSLTVRSSFMVAHSFHDKPAFGPAGGLHGATYTADVTFEAAGLHPENNWVCDIGAAAAALEEVLKGYNFKNLDELLPGEVTTTEFMCRRIFEDLKGRGGLIERGRVKVTLSESHKAWASYEGEI
ncbi:hypothetical protein TeGR_g2849 [Tetraparma gracilis]|uniref:6-pyruvoyltetrahydropterin synthase n=1 Tax=Tetraparma gracilis TaxID=2962635 RepID=A0ABQ6MQ97_9STRA|nr:hypothetical protein TeGR_g2849 [Tetraparma gracilis]